MDAASVEISPLTRPELDTLIGWAELEGWMPGTDDAEPFWNADADGFLAARIEGRMVAGISLVRFGPEFAFLGLFICSPQFRGHGIGARLISAALDTVGDRTVGLDAVPAQQEFYGRLGFRTVYRHVRFAGRPTTASAPGAGIELVPGSEELVAAAVAYDDTYFAGDRRAFMTSWLDPAAPTRRWLVARDGERIVGLGVIRQAPPGHKIGPLFAESPKIADALLGHLAAGVDTEVYVDIPDINAAARSLVAGHGMRPVFECARMYRGADPRVPTGNQYGACTLELG